MCQDRACGASRASRFVEGGVTHGKITKHHNFHATSRLLTWLFTLHFGGCMRCRTRTNAYGVVTDDISTVYPSGDEMR